MYCPHCGTQIQPGQEFCDNCGVYLGRYVMPHGNGTGQSADQPDSQNASQVHASTARPAQDRASGLDASAGPDPTSMAGQGLASDPDSSTGEDSTASLSDQGRTPGHGVSTGPESDSAPDQDRTPSTDAAAYENLTSEPDSDDSPAPESDPSPSREPIARDFLPVPEHPSPDQAYNDLLEPEAPAPRRNSTLPILLAVCTVLLVIIAALAINAVPPTSSSASSAGTAPGPAAGPTSAAIDPQSGERIDTLVRPSLLSRAIATDLSDLVPKAADYTVDPGLANVVNADDLYLTDEVKSLLQTHAFAVDATWGDEEFYEIYEQNRYDFIPSIVTVDSLMHTYHLYFQHLQKNVERAHLAAAVQGMGTQLLAASEEQLAALKGTEWEQAATRNVAFFAVAVRLQDDNAEVPAAVRDVVDDELGRIMAANQMDVSAITDRPEDYTQYKPRGYYEGNDVLERYFRTMMWYGRTNFLQKEEDLDRSALLMTLALTDDTLDRWDAVYAVTSFFAGASDDCNYCEYRPLVDTAYGAEVSVADLAGDDEAWGHFHALTATVRAPQVNSVPLAGDEDPDASRTDAEKGFRLMGQRFTLDEMIFTRLTYPNSGKDASGAGRMLPDALDVPAALGSDEALDILTDKGATAYANFNTNMQALRDSLGDEGDPRWFASLYSQWLYTLNPLLAAKGEGYPSFMQSSAWTRKSLQSYLGSFTELKHDTVLYAKQLMVEMGGGGIEERDDRGYVEAEPEVFARLADLTSATSEGLHAYGLLDDEDEQNLARLSELAQRLATIARKELGEGTVTDDEYELVRTYGGQLEHFWQEVYRGETDKENFTSRDFPAAVVVDVATNGDSGTVLELGTGRASTLYAIVPVDGTLRIARGSVFSFYEFEQPMSDRLTDTTWREMMGIEMGADNSYTEPTRGLEPWTDDFTMSTP